MEFPFNLNDYFNEEITIIDTNLLPAGFQGSSNATRLCVTAVSDIIDKMGQASARAQKLVNPVTSAIRYNNSDHIVYLLINRTENKYASRVSGRGTAVGFLKMGWKDLFIVDLNGTYTKRHSFCCLDFYIHETKQRQGFGKQLYDFMLRENNIKPGSIPIDRPSETFIKFLQKHYNLRTIIPQPTNFIVYEQYFGDNVLYTVSDGRQRSSRNIDLCCHPNYGKRTSINKVISDEWYGRIESLHR